MPKEKITKEVVKFDVETQVIVALDTKYKDVQITDGKSYALVMAAIGEYRELRLAVVDGHKKAKVKILEDGNWLDSEKRRILARLAPGEEKLKTIRQAWDDEKERIKKEKAEKETERIADIRARLSLIPTMISGLQIMGLTELKELSEHIESMDMAKGKYQEYEDEANQALDDTYKSVQDAIATRIQLDKEAEDRKADFERLEKTRKKQEADQKKIDEANKKIKAAQKKIDDDKKADEDRKEKEAFEKAANEKAEAAAAQKVIDDAAAKAEKDRAEEVEKERKAAMAPDKEKLTKWIASFNETNNPSPQLKSKKAKEIFQIGIDEITIILQDVEDKAELL